MPEVKYLETLISAEQIADKVTELARVIDRDYAGSLSRMRRVPSMPSTMNEVA